MKTIFLAALFPAFAHAQSISNLPQLSHVLIDHYDCRVAIIPSSGPSNELEFKISPMTSGHAQSDYTVSLGADKVVASANSQMISVFWTRGPQTIANSQAWVQNSTTQALVLIVVDPNDASSQVDMNCNGVTFDQVKK